MLLQRVPVTINHALHQLSLLGLLPEACSPDSHADISEQAHPGPIAAQPEHVEAVTRMELVERNALMMVQSREVKQHAGSDSVIRMMQRPHMDHRLNEI